MIQQSLHKYCVQRNYYHSKFVLKYLGIVLSKEWYIAFCHFSVNCSLWIGPCEKSNLAHYNFAFIIVLKRKAEQ